MNHEWVNKLMKYVWIANGTLLHNPEKMAEIVEQIRTEGIEAVVSIRCMKHRGSPTYNRNAVHGSECAACAVAERTGIA